MKKQNFKKWGEASQRGFQEVQEAQSPKEFRPREAHTKAHHDYITQD